jgi:hypothetical protein
MRTEITLQNEIADRVRRFAFDMLAGANVAVREVRVDAVIDSFTLQGPVCAIRVIGRGPVCATCGGPCKVSE